MSTLEEAARAIAGLNARFEKKRTLLPGLLGDGSGVVTGTRTNRSFVRIGSLPAQEVWNFALPNIEGLPIWVGYQSPEGTRLEVLGIDTSRLQSWAGANYVAPHAHNHVPGDAEAAYSDPLYVQKRMLVPLMVRPTSPPSLSVRIYDDYYPYGTSWQRYAGATVSLSSYLPAAHTGLFVTIYINVATNTAAFLAGTSFSMYSPPADAALYSYIAVPPVGSIPLAAVLLLYNTATVVEANIYDIRLIYNALGGTTTPIYNDNEGDPTLVAPNFSAIDGTSLYPARRDHRHNLKILNSGVPSGIQAYALSGTSPWAAKEDHVHPLSTGIVQSYMLSSGLSAQIAVGLTNDTGWVAKGDLAVGLGDNNAGILSVGTDGQVLTADASLPRGIKWATPSVSGSADWDMVLVRIWFGG